MLFYLKILITKSVDAINRSFVYILRQKSSPDDLMNSMSLSIISLALFGPLLIFPRTQLIV